MNDGLKQIAENIMFNEEIRELIQNPNQDGLYRELVDFQIKQCETLDLSIEKEGFQIGEPWNGDIENAPILFLSSNPAFDFYEVSPRYYSDKTGNQWVIKDGEVMSLDDLIKFQCTRIQESKIEDNDNNKENLNKEVFNPNTGKKDYLHVLYWGHTRERVECLLPDELKIFWRNKKTPAEYAREIMKYVVCMEIVPFRSNDATGVTTAVLDDCWGKFTKTILELSGASIFILVGSKAYKTFSRNLKFHASIEHNLSTGKTLELQFGERNRTIVHVPHTADLYNCLPSETIKQLRDTLARRIIFDNKIASGDFR